MPLRCINTFRIPHKAAMQHHLNIVGRNLAEMSTKVKGLQSFNIGMKDVVQHSGESGFATEFIIYS